MLEVNDETCFGENELELPYDDDGNDIVLPLSDYSAGGSMRGFMDFLLAAKKLKHLSSTCIGVFATPALLGVYAQLHSIHWDPDRSDRHGKGLAMAVSKFRESLWRLAQAVGRPEHKLEAADVQLLSRSSGTYAQLANEIAPLAAWLAQEEWAKLVAQSWNEQEERGPNERRVFSPVYITWTDPGAPRFCLTSAFQDPWSALRY